MKLLLDENLPKRLKQDFPEFEIATVRDQGWNGLTNGELIKLMRENGFDALITFDKNLQYQQNFGKYSLHVIVLTAASNRYKHLSPFVDEIKESLATPHIGVSIIGDRKT
jgi:predicted nuclease of predicted toxin-antitoxin system